MAMSGLGRVIASWANDSVPADWKDAAVAVEREREDVENVLSSPGAAAVYGFSTRLGHLDHLPRAATAEYATIRDHQTATPTSLDRRSLDLVTRCKLEQLHLGGSGIHPRTFTHLLEGLDAGTHGTSRGAWLVSYGSGDVIPAAWWVAHAIDASHREQLAAGDAIALMNGHFFSTARAISTVLAAADAMAELVASLGRYIHIPQETVSWPDSEGLRLRALVRGLYDAGDLHKGATQLPVSLRDGRPALAAIALAFGNVETALASRLSGASANPLFSHADDSTLPSAQSQSSFLDFKLTFALTGLLQAQHLALGLAQRVIEHLADAQATAAEQGNAFRYVQPPKAAQAVAERATMIVGTLPTRFSGGDSHGIEDLRDLSLLTADSAASLVTPLVELTTMLRDIAPEGGAETKEAAAEIAACLLPGLAEEIDEGTFSRAITMARELLESERRDWR